MLAVERIGSTVVWTIDRPDARNALDGRTMTDLLAAIREAAVDADLRAAIVTGAGEVFVSGGDLRELRARRSPEDAARLTDLGHEMTAALAALPFPTIAALSGPAIGGGAELAVACDMRIADERARIGFQQVRMAVTTAWGSVARLAAIVGAGSAARLLYTARQVSAVDAMAMGLVDEVTPNGQARTTALAWADEIALGAPGGVAAMKRLLRETLAAAPSVRALERELFIETWSSDDHAEAVEAYFARRPPRWSSGGERGGGG